MLASQRIESVVSGWLFVETEVEENDAPTKRGATPSAVEWLILAWVSGKLLNVNAPCTMSYFLFSFRSHLEWSEATVGHWFTWICQWHVERYRLCNQFIVCGNGGITCGFIFPGMCICSSVCLFTMFPIFFFIFILLRWKTNIMMNNKRMDERYIEW